MDQVLLRKYSFDSFIAGNSNHVAFSAALSIAESGNTKFNPFYVHGQPGLGKTHLLHAIGNKVLDINQCKKVKYVTAEDFVNDYTTAIRLKKDVSAFDQMYRGVDVLLIDDIQFFTEGKKEGSVEKFFNTFNSLYMNNKQIVIASDKHPMRLNNIDERLRSRFAQGLTVSLSPPDYETRVAILKDKLITEGIELTDEINQILEIIAQNVTRNVRELEGVLNRIIVHISVNNIPMTADFVEPIVNDYIFSPEKDITINSILESVAVYYQISPDEIKGKSRKQDIADARHVTMYLAKELTENSLLNIAGTLGGKDHATVIAGHKKVSALLNNNNRKIYHDIEEIRSMIEEGKYGV